MLDMVAKVIVKDILENIYDGLIDLPTNDDCDNIKDNKIRLGDTLNLINRYIKITEGDKNDTIR